jgi:hypothetical protein
MATNIDLNEKIISKAMRLAKLKTKKEAVNLALQEFVDRREQLKVIDLFGTVDFDESYDYKEQRTVQ